MNRGMFQVKGITCTGCATDIETVLKNTDGVIGASVNYPAGEVSVEYDSDKVSEQQITVTLQKLGLKVSVVG
jgi:copper chaperone CopZ